MESAGSGWDEVPPANDFVMRFGPLSRRKRGESWIYAIRADAHHRNGAGLMHGGAISAFIDEVAGTVVSETTGRRHVTVNISTSFMKAVEQGDLVEVDCRIVRLTRSMAFVEAHLNVGEEVVASASLIFKAVRANDAQ